MAPHPRPTADDPRPYRAALRLVALLLVLATCSAAPAAADEAGDLPIARLTVEADGPVDRDAVLDVLGLEVGGRLDRRLLRHAIVAMYAATGVDWVKVEAGPGPDGLDVLVRISRRPTVNQIRVEVDNRILRRRIVKWLELRPGDTISQGTVEAGQRRITRRLRERGFADPGVEVFLDYRRADNTVDVIVTADLGPPVTVGSVTVVALDRPEAAALAVPRVDAGARLTGRLEDRLRQQIENDLREAGYWEAEVLRLRRIGDGPQVDLEVVVDTGEHYRMEPVYPEEAAGAVLDALPDPTREEVHPFQTDALEERVRGRLQESGFLLAEVRAELESDATGSVLHIVVDPGRVRRVTAVEFPGADSLRGSLLRSAVTVREGPVRGLRGQDVSASSLQKDRLALVDLYRRQGFPEAVIDEAVIEVDGEDGARVQFPVTEGQRWFITELRIEGLPAETAAALESHPLPIEEATPWDPRELDAARRRLEGLLADTGYPDGRVAGEVDRSRPGEARVTFRAEPGDFVRIGRVVVAGLERTRESVVRRTLRRAGVVEGEAYSRAAMLEAQRHLYELALFRQVELVPMPGQERHAERGVVILLEEGLHRSYVVGVGWNETDRLRITLGWSHLNLLGGAHALSVEAQLSSREERFQLGLREPRLPGLDLPATLLLYRTYEEFATYSQRRRGLWIDLGDRYKRPFRSWWRYEYQIVRPDAPDDVLSELEREDQEARISSITPTLEWDFRDSPLVPTRGTYSELSLSYAFPVLQANAEFLKLQGRTTLYGPIANGRGAIGLRLGAMEPLGPDTGEPANLQVPLNIRFFAGGATTHRAFERDFLGVPGQTLNENGDPIGGNALVLVNAEYVRKISSLFSVTLFVDAGNVWASPSDVRLGDIRWGAGLGLWLDTRAGPLRLEYGWKLDREPGEPTGAWWLSFGIPF
ncbi:MAG TPA: BamA/TamA family outer membrane protein [Methylomirabilota bacterium]|nr:BamA/TamA family outer membrane protein [Methylomirabilota bacterium]